MATPNESGVPEQGSGVPEPGVPLRPSRLLAALAAARASLAATFGRAPTVRTSFLPFLLLSIVLYARLPTTNYIFDEQEALLANPYVNATDGLRYRDAIHRDFWGLPPDRSVGSYRPLPNYVWRAPWEVAHRIDGVTTGPRQRLQDWLSTKGWLPEGATVSLGEAVKRPFSQQLVNLAVHGLNGALLASLVYVLSRRRTTAWLTGAAFVACAVLTEAVSGIVGIADVLGGLGALLALHALRLPGPAMPLGVAAGLCVGLFSKESALVCVPLIPLAALLLAPFLHPERPSRALRTLLAAVATVFAFVLYVELRRVWFPSPLPQELETGPLPGAPWTTQLAHDFLVWFRQAPLPKDPLNNPLAGADTTSRIAGALRVYARGLGQVLFPWTLSGDYSFPQEPVPDRPVFFASVVGAAAMVLPPLASIGFWIAALLREKKLLRHEPRPPRDPGSWSVLGGSTLLLALAVVGATWDITRVRSGHPPLRIDGAWLLLVPFAAIDLLRAVTARLTVRPWALLAAAIAFAIDAIFLGDATDGMRFALLSGAAAVAALTGIAESLGAARAAVSPVGAASLALVALGATWVVVSYFPHSNIPVVLPTVRAERFWYFPAIGTSIILGLALGRLVRFRPSRAPLLGVALAGTFLAFQAGRAYAHAMDYRDDLVFWRATKNAVPFSAKAHLNYSIMVGARGDLATRLVESQEAMRLAPEWAMAHVYTGDVLCRMNRVDEAWPHYEKGFGLGPNDPSLIALGLQCLWDQKRIADFDAPLRKLATDHPGSWIAYLAVDTLDNGEKHGGVDPQYRPRGYNERAKDEAKASADGAEVVASGDPSVEPSVDASVEPSVDASVELSDGASALTAAPTTDPAVAPTATAAPAPAETAKPGTP